MSVAPLPLEGLPEPPNASSPAKLEPLREAPLPVGEPLTGVVGGGGGDGGGGRPSWSLRDGGGGGGGGGGSGSSPADFEAKNANAQFLEGLGGVNGGGEGEGGGGIPRGRSGDSATIAGEGGGEMGGMHNSGALSQRSPLGQLRSPGSLGSLSSVLRESRKNGMAISKPLQLLHTAAGNDDAEAASSEGHDGGQNNNNHATAEGWTEKESKTSHSSSKSPGRGWGGVDSGGGKAVMQKKKLSPSQLAEARKMRWLVDPRTSFMRRWDILTLYLLAFTAIVGGTIRHPRHARPRSTQHPGLEPS